MPKEFSILSLKEKSYELSETIQYKIKENN